MSSAASTSVDRSLTEMCIWACQPPSDYIFAVHLACGLLLTSGQLPVRRSSYHSSIKLSALTFAVNRKMTRSSLSGFKYRGF